MKNIDLKDMAFDDLIELRDTIESIISKRAAAEKRSLEQRLSRLAHYAGNFVSKPAGRSLKGRKAEPKYRNPADPSETWAGRGMKPRWLTALLAEGRQVDEFSIPRDESAARTAKSAGRKMSERKTGAGKPGRKPGRKPGSSKAA